MHSRLDVFVEPSDGLEESLLLCKLSGALSDVGADSEAMLDVGEEVDLVRDAHLLKDVFGLATLGSGEDVVGLWKERRRGNLG